MLKYVVPIALVVAVTAGAVATVAMVDSSSSPTSAVTSNTVVRTYEYGDTKRQRMDVYLPRSAATARYGSEKRPTVVLVHGGGWVGGSKKSMRRAAAPFVDLGYVAISVNYRIAPRHPFPTQRQDVRSALEYIRAHHKILRVNRNKIVVLGSSAGGEIAAAVLAEGNGSKLARGLVTLSAPLDLGLVSLNTTRTEKGSELATTVIRDLLPCELINCDLFYWERNAWAELDRRDPPSLVIASQLEWVDPQNSVRYASVARDRGVPSSLLILPGERHAMAYFDDAWPQISTWITQRMSTKA